MTIAAKSLGEKLFEALVIARAETTTWAALSDNDRAICERAARAFVAATDEADERQEITRLNAVITQGIVNEVKHQQALASITRERDAMRKALLIAAPHHQGGSSETGEAIAKALGVPFPIRIGVLPQKARDHDINPAALWPWLVHQAPSYFTEQEIHAALVNGEGA